MQFVYELGLWLRIILQNLTTFKLILLEGALRALKGWDTLNQVNVSLICEFKLWLTLVRFLYSNFKKDSTKLKKNLVTICHPRTHCHCLPDNLVGQDHLVQLDLQVGQSVLHLAHRGQSKPWEKNKHGPSQHRCLIGLFILVQVHRWLEPKWGLNKLAVFLNFWSYGAKYSVIWFLFILSSSFGLMYLSQNYVMLAFFEGKYLLKIVGDPHSHKGLLRLEVNKNDFEPIF